MIAAKYKKAVMNTITVLSLALLSLARIVSICSMRFGFWLKISTNRDFPALPDKRGTEPDVRTGFQWGRIGANRQFFFTFTDQPLQ